MLCRRGYHGTMVRFRVNVFKMESQIVYTVFYLESRVSEVHYILRCIAMSFGRFGYRIQAEQC